MKLFFFISVFFLLQARLQAGSNHAGFGYTSSAIQDTLIQDTVAEDRVIDEVIQTHSIPKQDKVEYLSQLTKYGFKNLFTKFRYNPSVSYSSQVNPQAELYMQDYLRVHSSYLVKMKSWGLPYFNLIDNIFTQYGLPKELKYLAVIESNLSNTATSPVGAGGPWQFMPYTARGMGLVVNESNDERRDYFKSTHAAARYLLALYRDLHDWLLVIAAYNGGPGRVYDAIKKSGSRDFWSLQYYLPLESRNHVKKFIATHYVMEAGSEAFNFTALGDDGYGGPLDNKPFLTPEEKVNTVKQTISGKFNSTVIAKNLSMDLGAFNRFNPDLDNRLAQNGQFDLVLPEEKMQLFLANKYQILNECVQLLLSDNQASGTKTVYPASRSAGGRKKRS
jgi:membrane-bound lytic murein transglycosylase D